MKHRFIIAPITLGLAAVVSILPALPAHVHAATRQSALTAATISAPPVPNAAALMKKYGSKGITLTYVGDAVGLGHNRDLILAAEFTKDTGIGVNIIPQPVASTDSYSQKVRNFQAKSSAFDVMMIDVVWPGAFAPYLVDLKPYFSAAAIKQQAAGIVANDTVGGHLVAMPWFGDFGILYYRTDLLKKYGFSHPPKTWDELTSMAKTIQAGERKSNSRFSGFVFQGNAYEGLTCDALEWLASSGTPNFVVNGKADLNNPKAIAMLKLAQSWIGTISPRGVTTYQEGDAQVAFTSGNAAFERNWPYAYALNLATGSKVIGKFDVTTLPAEAGSQPVGTVGGWQLAVSKFSKNIPASVEFLRYMTSPAAEKFNAIYAGLVPTMASVASDPQVLKAQPYLKPAIANVMRVTRPAGIFGVNYTKASQVIFQGINQVLNGSDPSSIVSGLDTKLNAILAQH
ncbi:MAG TPA: ABC transporter substrate-binding protein [Chloroflexota bacterium]|nr:ABC transporter substrate-binding protein [Chloroflexota bacterium]